MEDGQVRADHAWARRLRRAIADEPLAGSLIAACASLASVGIDIDLLEEIFRRQERDWRRQRKLEGLGLPDSFMNFALAIYVYTLEDPAVYTVVNRAMYNPERRGAQGVLPGADLSPELQACLPYIRFLDTALERLPEAFIFRGRVHRGVRSPPHRARTHPRLIEYTRNRPPLPPPRMTECSPLRMTEWVSTRLKGPRTLGTTPPTLRLTPAARRAQVKWVYPGPDNHDPERYFRRDATIYWYEFKSTSRKRELMSQPKFCGHEPGPRTHFVIEATRAYSIVEFSSFGEEEAEVLSDDL